MREERAPSPRPLQMPSPGSVLAKDFVVTGSVASKGNIEILGKVDGDVDSKGSVTISGEITGNVLADSLRLSTGHIQGNVACQKDVAMDADALVCGDVAAESILCGGKIEGNLNILHKTELRSTAIIDGDVTTGSISMEEGAGFKGKLQTGADAEKDEKPQAAKAEKRGIPAAEKKPEPIPAEAESPAHV